MARYGRLGWFATGILLLSAVGAPGDVSAAGPAGPTTGAGSAVPGAGSPMCGPWERLGSSRRDVSLADAVAMGDGTALAVGSTGPQMGTRTTRYERWNGTRWRTVAGPSADGKLVAIAREPGTSRAWAVGAAGLKVLIMRWKGGEWSQVAIDRDGLLMGVSVARDGSTWAVGWDYPDPSTSKPMVLRRTANGWKPEALPAIIGQGRLYGVAARSATDVWVVGWQQTPLTAAPLIMHRSASGWAQFPAPPVSGSALLMDVAAWAPDAATAVGWVQTTNGQRGIVIDWDGHDWTVPALPGGTVGLEVLEDVVHADGVTWAVGTAGVWGDARGVILRRASTGATWTARTADRRLTPLSAFVRLGRDRSLAVGGELDGLDVRVVVGCG